MSRGYRISVKRAWQYFAALLLLCPLAANAQFTTGGDIKPLYTIDNGKMVITLDKHIADSVLYNFITLFNLYDLDIPDLIKNNISDSLRKKGWRIEQETNGLIMLSKRLDEMKSALTEKQEKPERREKPEKQEQEDQPVLVELMQLLTSIGEKETTMPESSSSQSGANHFINKKPFHVTGSQVTFYMRGYPNAHQVFLAGTFTDWQNGKLPMQKTDSGWIVNVKLDPGKYDYKFITDGNWMTDCDNKLTENDDENSNSVYYKTNKVFTLHGYPDAKKVVLAGSFNKWSSKEIVMEHTGNNWQVPLYLSPGTYTYLFVVDGKWTEDPANDLKLPNEFGRYNSLVQIGAPYVFKLQGHTDAKAVVLAGSFNDWRTDQLYMFKTATGWELPYVLGPAIMNISL